MINGMGRAADGSAVAGPTHARVLDRRRFQRLTSDTDPSAVLAELDADRNRGGWSSGAILLTPHRSARYVQPDHTLKSYRLRTGEAYQARPPGQALAGTLTSPRLIRTGSCRVVAPTGRYCNRDPPAESTGPRLGAGFPDAARVAPGRSRLANWFSLWGEPPRRRLSPWRVSLRTPVPRYRFTGRWCPATPSGPPRRPARSAAPR